MDLNHDFTVDVPVEEAWRILTDVERIAPCLPGAQLQEIEGDIYRGVVKVKVGPIQAQFKGQASFVERDDAAHRVVLKGEGRDTGGKGNASALITATLTSAGVAATQVKVHTDLSITGKVAQFGRGAMADISDKLLAQFVDNLDAMISAGGAAPAPTSAPAPSPEPALSASAGAPPEVRRVDAPEAAPIDLLATAGGTVMRRVVPAVVAVVAVIVTLVVLL
jgi:carbon monoxide dehydrogenase subunit G